MVRVVLASVGTALLVATIMMPLGPLGGGLAVLSPVGGMFDTGRSVRAPVPSIVSLDCLSSDVEVLVDEYGIPHIYAHSLEDAYAVLGYFHARDRLFQMFAQNRYAAGRMCEVTGPLQSSVVSDKFYRTIGLARSAQKTLEWYEENAESNPNVALALRVIDAEVAGVNAYIDSLTTTDLPLEFKILGIWPEHWTRHDVFLWSKMMSWSLSGSTIDLYRYWLRSSIDNESVYRTIMADLATPYSVPIVTEQTNLSLSEYPNAPGGYPAVFEPPANGTYADNSADIRLDHLKILLDTLSSVRTPLSPMGIVGSNNWAVSGSRTSTGKPMLANDPHLQLQAPSLWYEAHIVVPGVVNIIGVTLPGLPGILLGHNEHTAWGFTNVGADVVDFFVEQVDPNNQSRYLYNSEYREFREIDESIACRDGSRIPFTVRESVHGPIIDGILDTSGIINLAMNWTGNGVTHEILSLTMINMMQDIDDYVEAVYWWDCPAQNIIYADDSGNIAITVAGRYPVRAGYSGEVPVVATDDSTGMVGSIPYAFIPRSVNPSQGYLQSANQNPVDPTDYGYTILGPFDDGYRGRRIDSLLAADSNVTVLDMMRYQADSLEVRAQRLVPLVIEAWDASGESNTTVANAVELLRDWNYVMDTDTAAPTLWMFLLKSIHVEVFDEAPDIDPSLLTSRTSVLEWILHENATYLIDDHRTGDRVETRGEILVRALYRALEMIVAYTGTADPTGWSYGNYHQIHLNHVAFGPAVRIVGGPHRGQATLNAAPGWNVGHGPSWRMVIDLSNIAESYGVYPGGQSGSFLSPHWEDLFRLWYAFDQESQTYGYANMYFYGTAAMFRAADSDRIEYSVTFTAGGS
ncbi:MAG: penicillin acylase family protein [Candidatus Thorarchaeota archaeon]